MNKIKIRSGMTVYSFAPKIKNDSIGFNIVTLERGDDILMIDTAFKRHFNQVKEELDNQNKTIIKVIITHFHRDHIGGLSKLKDTIIYGSKNYEKTLKKAFVNKNYDSYKPTDIVQDKKTITFGDFKIDMYVNEGHSTDGLLVVVDDHIIMPGDDIIFTYDKEAVAPYLSEGNAQAQINSLLFIKSKLTNKSILIPSHGHVMKDKAYILDDINFRLAYLYDKLKNPKLTVKEFNTSTNIHFKDFSKQKDDNI